jgi:hypothetical protein
MPSKKTKKLPSDLAKSHNPYNDLQLIDQQAVDMKIERVPMVLIAHFMGMTYDSCRDAFCRGGRLYEPLIYRQREVKESYRDIRAKVTRILSDTAIEAAITMRQAVRKGGVNGVIAAKDVLDRTGFLPPDKKEQQSEEPTEVERVQFYLPDNGRNVVGK